MIRSCHSLEKYIIKSTLAIADGSDSKPMTQSPPPFFANFAVLDVGPTAAHASWQVPTRDKQPLNTRRITPIRS
jgi:hypothetical protein